MCMDVFIVDKGAYCSTQGELAAAIGEHNFVKEKHYDDMEYKNEMCLCPIDLYETGQKAGYAVSQYDKNGEYDPFNIHYITQPSE